MFKTKYKPGDVVVVRPDLTGSQYYYMEHDSSNGNITTPDMRGLSGQAVKIVSQSLSGQYEVEGLSNLHWTDGMFEGLASEQELDSFETENIGFLYDFAIK